MDLFANNLEGVRSRIPYFRELGLTYLHLMPLFKVPEGENDGGYAVSSYREVHPPLGTMDELTSLWKDLRERGSAWSWILSSIIHPMNTCGQERAREGDEEYLDFYHIFPDR